MNLTTCLYHNLTTNNSSHGLILQLKEALTVPILVLLVGTLLLAGIILVALAMSGCFRNPTALLYFNMSLADILMAFIGISLLLLPTSSTKSGIVWSMYQILSLVIFIPRSVWMQTVLCLMINRYSIVRGKRGITICTTYLTILILWLNCSLQAFLWHSLSPGGPLYSLNTQITGVILNNVLVLALALPLPVVVVLLILIGRKARQHISRLSDEQYDVSQQMEGSLRLLYVFGAVYILGFGLTCVNNFNNLINLCGYVHVTSHWESDPTYCQYLFFFDGVCNIIVNLANSLIIVQTRHVKVALKRIQTATSRVVRNVSRRRRDSERRDSERRDEERLIRETDGVKD